MNHGQMLIKQMTLEQRSLKEHFKMPLGQMLSQPNIVGTNSVILNAI
jgi:hypothetical protein